MNQPHYARYALLLSLWLVAGRPLEPLRLQLTADLHQADALHRAGEINTALSAREQWSSGGRVFFEADPRNTLLRSASIPPHRLDRRRSRRGRRAVRPHATAGAGTRHVRASLAGDQDEMFHSLTPHDTTYVVHSTEHAYFKLRIVNY